jgi:hypothetical protein
MWIETDVVAVRSLATSTPSGELLIGAFSKPHSSFARNLVTGGHRSRDRCHGSKQAAARAKHCYDHEACGL